MQGRRKLPHAARGAAQKAIDEGRAEQTRAAKQAQKQIDAISVGAAPLTLAGRKASLFLRLSPPPLITLTLRAHRGLVALG